MNIESISYDLLSIMNKLLDTLTIKSLRSTNHRFYKELCFYELKSNKITNKLLRTSNYSKLKYLDISQNNKIVSINHLKHLKTLKIEINSNIRGNIVCLSHLKEFIVFDGKENNSYTIEKIDMKIWNKFKNDTNYVVKCNGNRPFKFVNKNKTIIVFKLIYNRGYDNPIGGITVLMLNEYKKIFIGSDHCDKSFEGNSILICKSIQDTEYEYIFIGQYIYSFKTKDEIIKYYSPVGNSEVPYPYACSLNNTYLMIEKVFIKKILFDPYSSYYFDNKIKNVFEKYETKLICRNNFMDSIGKFRIKY